MEANIIEGVYMRVSGEAGKTNGLAWRIVENMFTHLQEIIRLLAKYELETDISPNLKEFDIEIFDFKPGSAVPAFRIIPPSQQELIPIIGEQKTVVAQKFDTLMAYANKGNYELFFDKEQLPEVRYEIAEELYGFTLSTESSPLSIVRPLRNTGGYEEIYQVPKFNKQQYDYLLKPKKRRQQEEPEQMLALVQRVGKRKRILDLYENKDTILSIAPTQIIVDSKIYHLHTPLVCTIQKEGGNFIIEHEMLDLYAAGTSIDEAEHDFYSEFDTSYRLLESLSDNELSDRLLRAKNMMRAYIKEITQD